MARCEICNASDFGAGTSLYETDNSNRVTVVKFRKELGKELCTHCYSAIQRVSRSYRFDALKKDITAVFNEDVFEHSERDFTQSSSVPSVQE